MVTADMIVDVSSSDFPIGLDKFDAVPGVVVSDGAVNIAGDNTYKNVTYIYISRDICIISNNISTTLNKIKKDNLLLTIDKKSISHLLHDGLVPLPDSVFDQIKILSIGYSARIGLGRNGLECDVDFSFPYLSVLSRQDSTPSVTTLFELILNSVEAGVAQRCPVLMLSSGKDSVSLALALAELGINGTRCITYTAEVGKGEDAIASALARQLGLKHEVVSLPADERFVRDALESFFERSPTPCCDPAQIAFLLSLSVAGITNELVLDGTGNDSYMGYVPPRMLRLKYLLPLEHVPGTEGLRRLLSCCRLDNGQLDRFLRSGAELAVTLGSGLRPRETNRFFDQSFDTTSFWTKVTKAYAHLDVFDFEALIRGTYINVGSAMLKAWLASRATHNEMFFPWCDSKIAEYNFHLPEPFRFDRRQMKNKILLRNMLLDKFNYDDKTKVNRGMIFDKTRFLENNLEFVKEEVRNCALWGKSVESILGQYSQSKNWHPNRSQSLLNLFMISGWYNRSRRVRSDFDRQK